MPLYIDEKFANLLSPRLPLFKWKGHGIANFRCPLCGDSKRSKTKKRGYFYPHDDVLMFKCQNCTATMPFGALLKQLDTMLYKEYTFEAFSFNNDHKWYEKKQIDKVDHVTKTLENDLKQERESALKSLTCCTNLEQSHPCYKYLKRRKIPLRFWSDLYYTDNYCKWVNDFVVPNKFEFVPDEDKRLVIPFFTVKGIPYAYQGRDILDKPNGIRYITIHPKENENALLIFGLERLEPKKDVYVLEGPIDSMYIPNAVAVAGSALPKLLSLNKKKFIYVFDNEPRSPEIIELMERIIDNGSRLVIWPSDIKEKDVGEMIENGISAENVLDIMQKNTYNSLDAMLKFSTWRKV